MYVDDCVEGMLRLIASDYGEPLNLGTDRLVTINQLVDIISGIAGKRIDSGMTYISRKECVAVIVTILGSIGLRVGTSVSLESGLEITYKWIESELRNAIASPSNAPVKP